MESFKVDVILSSLKDLKEVKKQNEMKLTQECMKREELEEEVEKVRADYSSLSVKQAKLIEDERISEQRVMKMEAQLRHLEVLNSKKRERIEQLNKRMSDEQDTEQKQLFQFEQIMTGLAEKFRTAASIYSDEHLTQSILEYKERISRLKQQVLEREQLLLELSCEEQSNERIAEVDKQLAIDMFFEENRKSQEKKMSMEERLACLVEQCNKLDQRLHELKDELYTLMDSNPYSEELESVSI